MKESSSAGRVMLTGATGFVGRSVMEELVRRGHGVVCLVRSPEKLRSIVSSKRLSGVETVRGDLFDAAQLTRAASGCDAVIHLVGIILERPLRRQTFSRIHDRGTRNVVAAVKQAGVQRYVHMSALGTRPDAASRYHQTKFAAEQHVRDSGLDWTIFQPSLIHGPDGEFMQLMRRFACSLIPPVMPYFGSGQARVQPVSVKDVARCFVAAIDLPDTVGRVFPMGGPKSYSWRELYSVCRRLMPGAKRWKPMVSQPVWLAKLVARTVMKTPLVPASLRFNVDQVIMSQEDSTCDISVVQEVFSIKLRGFEEELTYYADSIP